MTFGGGTFDPKLDGGRLKALFDRALALMSDGQWRTLAQVHEQIGGTEASVSARLRDFRKIEFGGYCMESLRDPKQGRRGLWWYRLLLEKKNDRTGSSKPMQFTRADMRKCCEVLFRHVAVFDVSPDEAASLGRLYAWMRTSCENK